VDHKETEFITAITAKLDGRNNGCWKIETKGPSWGRASPCQNELKFIWASHGWHLWIGAARVPMFLGTSHRTSDTNAAARADLL
jgi:hypothetical protein